MASVDRRSQVGKYINSLTLELVAHVGNPTPAQRLLIQQAALKSAKLGMLVDRILANNEPDVDLATRCCLSWSNSLRRDLEALGLERAKKLPTKLADVIRPKVA